MVNALNTSVVGLTNQIKEMDGVKVQKKQETPEVLSEASKVEKLKKTIESGEYKLDMEKTAKALIEF